MAITVDNCQLFIPTFAERIDVTSKVSSFGNIVKWSAYRSATYCRPVCMVCKYALSMIAKTTFAIAIFIPIE